MEKEYKTIKYNGAYFSTYAKERAELISQGWKLEDENLIHSQLRSGNSVVGNYVCGYVVFSKETN
jgi:hypothetical protein